MPQYQYRCPECVDEKGNPFDFERILPIPTRYEGTCTRCGRIGTLRISLSRYRLAQPFYVLDADGRVLQKQADSEATEPPTPPEKAHWLKGTNRVEV